MMGEPGAARTDDGKPVRHRISAKAWWAITYHLRDTPRLTQKIRAEDVLKLGISGLLQVKGLEHAEVAAVFGWASAKIRAQRPSPTEDERFERIILDALRAEDPAAEMERIARELWWGMPEYERKPALGRLSSDPMKQLLS